MVKNISRREYYECRACNLGVFGNCSCHSEIIYEKEYWCEKCMVKVLECRQCHLFFYYTKKINNHTYCSQQCLKKRIDEIKSNNPDPSNIYEKYIFSESLLCWELSEKKCCSCSATFWGCNKKCDDCIGIDEINELKTKYEDFEFIFTDGKKIKGRTLCICGLHTEWIDKFYITETDNIVQCKNCNPSTTKSIYYYDYTHTWKLLRSAKKCQICDILLWKEENGRQWWGDVIQCNNHKPIHDYIKFKMIDNYIGYKIYKRKVFKKDKHYWEVPYFEKISTDYRCNCDKCGL
jgi:hypothetical protein